MSSIGFEKFPSTTRLYRDFLGDFPRAAPFLGLDFRLKESFSSAAKKVLARPCDRTSLVSILSEQNRAFGASAKTVENLKKFTEGNALAVFTGQQAGLFGGPIFTLYKAWTVLHLAEKLERELGQPVVPFFWMAADDHDFAEVDHTFLINKDNRLQKLPYVPVQLPSGEPMGKVRIDDSIGAALNGWKEAFNDTDFKSTVLDSLRAAYSAGKTFPDAFAAWMNRLLGDFGLVFVNPNDARLKELAVSFFVDEIGLDGTSQSQVAVLNEKLLASGYHVQVHKNRDLVNLFYQPDKREALRKGEGGFVSEGSHRFTTTEIEQAIRKEPGNFSPNVLLRPVLQSFLFPVVSVVLGPSEVAYFAQTGPLFELHKIPFPVVYPRKSVTLLEGRVSKVLDRHHLSLLDFTGDLETLLGRLVRESEGKELETKVMFARQSTREAIDALKRELVGLDPTLEKTVEQVQARFDLEIQNLEKKGVAAAKRKNETLRDQIYRTKNLLFPEGELQERKLSATYFLVKYGFDIFTKIRREIDFESFDHQVIPL